LEYTWDNKLIGSAVVDIIYLFQINSKIMFKISYSASQVAYDFM
jgi:hypothetical protein